MAERCAVCGRAVYLTDFSRGLAEDARFWSGPAVPGLGEPDERVEHTYDCGNASRRLTRKEAPDATP
jgi:hypothetical protein